MRDFDLDFPQRTDLADEAAERFREKSGRDSPGICARREKRHGFDIHILDVLDERGEAASGKSVGRYLTLDVGRIWTEEKKRFHEACETFAYCVRTFLPRGTGHDAPCMLAALGNRAIIADAIGPITADHFIVTRHIRESNPEMFASLEMRETLCLCPGVLGNTGVEAAEIIGGTAASAKPGFVIAVDALASRKLSRLATTIQICDTGISPGSGIYNTRKALNRATLGVPVIAIGVPTVVEATTLAVDILRTAAEAGQLDKAAVGEIIGRISEQNEEGFFVTPKETDHIIKDAAKLIGYGLNLALHDNLSFDDIDEFLS